MAMDEKQALQLARTVVQQKIVGQADTLEQHQELPGSMRSQQEVRGLAAWLDIPDIPWLQSSERLMQLEGKAANAYFEGWLGYALETRQVGEEIATTFSEIRRTQ
jgi:CRISPR/Cas system-associated endonuclease Cas1